MMSFLQNMFSEQISLVMEYVRTIAGIALAVAAVYTSIMASSLFLPKVRQFLGLINKLFGIGVLLSILGGAALIHYLTPPARVVYVQPPVPVEIDFPDFSDLPDMPDIPVAEIAKSASELAGAVAVAASESVEEIGKALTPALPTPEQLAEQREKRRIAQRNQQLQAKLNDAYRQLLQASQRFGFTGYIGGGSLGLHTWQNRYQSSGRAARATRNRLQKQLEAAADRTADQFQLIENDLFDSLDTIVYGRNSLHKGFRVQPFGRSISNRVKDCKSAAWQQAARNRSSLSRINTSTIHTQVAQWRSAAMREELRYLVDELRAEWVDQVNSTYSVTLR